MSFSVCSFLLRLKSILISRSKKLVQETLPRHIRHLIVNCEKKNELAVYSEKEQNWLSKERAKMAVHSKKESKCSFQHEANFLKTEVFAQMSPIRPPLPPSRSVQKSDGEKNLTMLFSTAVRNFTHFWMGWGPPKVYKVHKGEGGSPTFLVKVVKTK